MQRSSDLSKITSEEFRVHGSNAFFMHSKCMNAEDAYAFQMVYGRSAKKESTKLQTRMQILDHDVVQAIRRISIRSKQPDVGASMETLQERMASLATKSEVRDSVDRLIHCGDAYHTVSE